MSCHCCLFFLTHLVCNIFWCQTVSAQVNHTLTWTRTPARVPGALTSPHRWNMMIVSFTSSDIFLQFVNPMKDFSLSRKETCLSSCLHIFSPMVHLCAPSPLLSPCVWQFCFVFFSYLIAPHGKIYVYARCSCGGRMIQDVKQTWHLLSAQGRCLFNEPSSFSSPNQHSL